MSEDFKDDELSVNRRTVETQIKILTYKPEEVFKPKEFEHNLTIKLTSLRKEPMNSR